MKVGLSAIRSMPTLITIELIGRFSLNLVARWCHWRGRPYHNFYLYSFNNFKMIQVQILRLMEYLHHSPLLNSGFKYKGSMEGT
jgi:hypothetical protein